MTSRITNKNMKTINILLLAGAVALGFTLTTTAKADEPLFSPKAAALRHDFRRVPSTDASPNLVSGNYLGAGARNPFPMRASYEIAPLVGKDKSSKCCEADCTMPCCAKK